MAHKKGKRRSQEQEPEHRKGQSQQTGGDSHETVEGSRAQGAAGEAGGQEDRDKR